MAKTVLLTSKCNVEGFSGAPGETVTFKDEALADRIIAGRGGVEVKTPAKKAPAKKTEGNQEGAK